MPKQYSLHLKQASIDYYRCSANNTVKNTLNIFNISNGSLFNWSKLKDNNNLTNYKNSIYVNQSLLH